TIQVTTGEPVRLVIRSKDTVHGFSIPELKIDVRIPKGGTPVVVEFVAPPPGRFEIACSEFCGSGHGQLMPAWIRVAAVIHGAPPARLSGGHHGCLSRPFFGRRADPRSTRDDCLVRVGAQSLPLLTEQPHVVPAVAGRAISRDREGTACRRSRRGARDTCRAP